MYCLRMTWRGLTPGKQERPFCAGMGGETVVLSVVDGVMLPTINAYLLAMGHTE